MVLALFVPELALELLRVELIREYPLEYWPLDRIDS
jgi:hypothetical protein